MNDSLLKIKLDGKSLFAVPAVPYTVIFAEHVNRLCRMQDTKPSAIAVELGPQSAKECATWLKELIEEDYFPCMLALVKNNNRIRPSYKELSDKLQEETGKDINDFSQEVLKYDLNYSGKSILPITPTDSIIEAIRCALELNIPLYGIDLDETADAQREEAKIEDSSGKYGKNLKDYIERNSLYAEFSRDEEMDCRRERVIASRLRTVMQKHDRVLYTGGLTRWNKIEEALLNKKDILPAAPVEEVSEVSRGEYTRCIVHPLLAINFMDVFPAFAERYGDQRKPVNTPRIHNKEDFVEPISFFPRMLQEAYQDFFHNIDGQIGHCSEDIYTLPVFEQLLSNLCMVRQKLIPDVFTIIEAAQGTMTPQFCKNMANILMKLGRDWVSNNDFPELPVFAPVPIQTGPYTKGELLYADERRSSPFYFNLLHDRCSIKSKVSIPWEWSEKFSTHSPPKKILIKQSLPKSNYGNLRTWPPRDYLITAMSLDAMQRAKRRYRGSVAFQGSLLDGIDIKT